MCIHSSSPLKQAQHWTKQTSLLSPWGRPNGHSLTVRQPQKSHTELSELGQAKFFPKEKQFPLLCKTKKESGRQKAKEKLNLPVPGLEPGYPAWKASMLTTYIIPESPVLFMMNDEFLIYKHLFPYLVNPPIHNSATATKHGKVWTSNELVIVVVGVIWSSTEASKDVKSIYITLL